MTKSIEQMVERYESIIEKLEEKIDTLESDLERAEAYSKAKAFYQPILMAEVEGMPVPRLQISLERITDYRWEWLTVLVTRYFDTIQGIPMSQTTSSGGHRFDTFETLEDVQKSLPHRDGYQIRRDAKELNLPAFAFVDGRYHRLTAIE